MTRPLNGYALVLVSALLLGTLGVFSKLFYDAGGEPFTLLFLRFAAGGPLLILIALIEFTTGSSTWLWVASGAFLIARVAHPLGMDGVPGGRMVGTLITFLLLLGLGAYAISLPFLTAKPVAHTELVTPAG